MADSKRPNHKSNDDDAGLDEDQFGAAVSALVKDAVRYVDEDIAPQREKATAYYRGDPLGTEQEGSSQVVLTEVRDTVNAILPGLCRIFDSTGKPVEFQPSNSLEVELAAEQTDAVNYFFRRDDGFRVLHHAFKDALVRKIGVLTWWAEERASVREFVYRNYTQEMIDLAEKTMDGWTIVSQEPEHDSEDGAVTPAQADPANAALDPAMMTAAAGQMGLPIPKPPETFTIRVRRTTKENKIRIDCIPPEEYFISRDSQSELESVCQGRRREVTISELVSLGYDEDEIRENAGTVTPYGVSSTNMEALTRNPALTFGRPNTTPDKSLDRVLYTEAYVRVDKDGDSIAELRRVCLLGEHHYVLHDEIWEDEEAPFALLCPIPEPHMAIGLSVADLIMDIQLIKSNIVRHTLDSLAESIHPRTVVIEGQVNMDDVLNTEQGAVIRARQPGAVQELDKTFVGQQALGVLAYVDDIKARRTGVSDASLGLDPDVLQSTNVNAVKATIDGGKDSIELIARIFAETGIKRLFKGLLRTIIRHCDEPLEIRTNDGTFRQIDPSLWNPESDVTVNVGLGRGSESDRFSMLGMIASKQEQILQLAGLDNPTVGPNELRTTYAKMLEIGGFKDATPFFRPIPPNWQPPPKQQPSDPNVILAQVEMQKIQLAKQSADQGHQLKMMQMQADYDLKRAQLDQDRFLKIAEIQAKYSAQIDSSQIDADVARYEAEIGALTGTIQGGAQLQHDAQQAGHDRLHAMSQAHDAHIAGLTSDVLGHVANAAQPMTAPGDRR